MLLKKGIIIVISAFYLVSCGGGGSGGNVSELPKEEVLENESASNLFPLLDLKAIETPEYFSQWGLDFINASNAYVIGGTGKGVTIAVVDEAIDWGHHEFLKENIFHPDSILTYSGNREPTAWEKFHGTATASIIAARRDDQDIPSNMQGVAYESQILFIATELGEPPADGDYVPISIEKYDWSYYDSLEAKLYDNLSSKAQIVNNSFGFTGQITDYPKEIFEENFPKFINSLRKNNDTIFVWSAGNYNGITDTSGNKVDATDPGWLAGLPYYFPKLEENNIAVVAIDREGKIADWSNRCGVAKNSCIAAPGSRINVAIPNNLYSSLSDNLKSSLNEDVLNYLKDHPTEAYLLASGTSFAAPHVTGALAVLTDIFGRNLKPSEIVERLYNSANKAGEYSNTEIYGHGVLDLGAAVSPIGLLSFYDEKILPGSSIPIKDSRIGIGNSIGDSLIKGFKDISISVFDAFGAPFSFKMNSFLYKNSNSRFQLERLLNFKKRRYISASEGLITFSSWDSILNNYGYSGLRLSDAGFHFENNKFNFSLFYGLNPSSHLFHPLEKVRLSSSFMNKDIFEIPWLRHAEDGFSLSFSLKNISQGLKINLFSGTSRQDEWISFPSFIIPKQNRSFGGFVSFSNHKNNDNLSLTFGFLGQKDQLLDHSSYGAFGHFNNVKTIFLSTLNKFQISKNWNLIANFNISHVLPNKSKKYIKRVSDLYESSFDIGFLKKKFFNENDTLAILVSQKPYAEKGKLNFRTPIGRDYERNIHYKTNLISLSPSGRNLSLQLIWSDQMSKGSVSSLFDITYNQFNIKSNDLDVSWLMAYKKSF